MSSKFYSKRLLSRKAKYTINPRTDKEERKQKEVDLCESEQDVENHQMLPQTQQEGQQTLSRRAAKIRVVRRAALWKRVLCIVVTAGLILLTTSLSLQLGIENNRYSQKQTSQVNRSQEQSNYEMLNKNSSQLKDEAQVLNDKNEDEKSLNAIWKQENFSVEIDKLNNSYNQLLAEPAVNTSELQSSFEILNKNQSVLKDEAQMLKDQNEEISKKNNSFNHLQAKVLVNTSQLQSSFDTLNQNHSQIKTDAGQQILKDENNDTTVNTSLLQSRYEILTKNPSQVKDEVEILKNNNTVNTSLLQSNDGVLNQSDNQLKIEAQMLKDENQVTLEISKLSNSYSQLFAKLLEMAVNTSQLQRSYETLNKNHSLLKDEVQMLKDKDKVFREISKLNTSYIELLDRLLGMATNTSQLQSSYEILHKNHNQLKDEAQMMKDKNEASLEISKLNNSYSQLLAKLLEMTVNSSQLQSSYEKLNKNYNTLKKDVQRLKNKNKDSLKIDKLNSSYSHLLATLLDLAVNTSELQSSYETLTKNHSLLKDEVQTLKDKNEAMAVNMSQLQSSFETLKNAVQMLRDLHDDMCHRGWTSFRDHCYFKSTESKTWPEAREDCQNRGADLVIVNSEDEKTFLIELTARQEMWIGLRLQMIEKTKKPEWRWLDGTVPSKDFFPRQKPKSYEVYAVCCNIFKRWTSKGSLYLHYWVCEK
ncbi:C-type lectin domain family 4 member F isoform X2 [Kryptolebias marmoratus]|uniref:C-type lectin domain family 4 member F isoform X2 n=1 Tax=Kryptolebias marmoratus TaxID=37003 RepID=UPI0007F8DAB6|nr:C-type lectin domain family 4 member F isoform X2 [Kryptolebias marmoratus]